MKKLDNHNLQMFSHFDPQTNILYVVNKGQSFTQFFFYQDGETPSLTALDKYQGKENQLFLYFLPKKQASFMDNELLRGIRLAKNRAEYIGFKVPRKSGGFQEDLYPPYESGNPVMTYDEYASGKNSIPDLMSFDPAATDHHKVKEERKSNFQKQVKEPVQ